MDWPLHACENLIETKTPQLAFAVPYYYEDTLSAKELATIPLSDPIFHSHSVRYVNSNREMIQSTIPSLIEFNAVSHDEGGSKVTRGLNPNMIQELKGYMYAIDINIGDKEQTVTGFIPEDMIFKENDQNTRAQAISGGGGTFVERAKNVLRGGARRALSKDNSSLVFWPDNNKIRRLQLTVPLYGDFTLTLRLIPSNLSEAKSNPETIISYVTGGYSLRKHSSGWLQRADRKVQQTFQRQLALKFKGETLAPKNLSVHRFSDYDGNSVLLTFSMSADSSTAQLVDVEYMAKQLKFQRNFSSDADTKRTMDNLGRSNTKNVIGPDDDEYSDSESAEGAPAEAKAQISSRFTCDPRNFDEIGGLVMALDFVTSTATPDMDRDTLKNLESASSVIKKYANFMQTNDGVAPDKIPSEVHVAIQTGLDTLFEPIEMSGDQNYWRKKMNKSFENMCQDVVPIIVAAQNARKGNPKVKVFRSLKKGIYNKKLNTISTVLTAHISSLKANDVKPERIAKYQELLDAVTSTLRGEDVNTSKLCLENGITVQSTPEEQ